MNSTKAKTAKRDRKINLAKKWVTENRPHFCKSCGATNKNLSCSHTLSVRNFPQYSDDTDNILLMCLSCHARIENWDIVGMHYEQQIREYVQSVEPEHYNALEESRRLDKYLIVREDGAYMTDRYNTALLEEERNGETTIIEVDTFGLMRQDREFSINNPLAIQYINLLKITGRWSGIKKRKT